MADAVVLGPGEGEALGGAATVTIKVGGAQTGGSLYIGESVVPPGFPGPRPTSTSACTTCSTCSRAR